MFNHVKKLFKGQSSGASSNRDALPQAFIYKYCFSILPRKFFHHYDMFARETQTDQAIGRWSKEQLGADSFVHVADFTHHPKEEGSSRALMAAAVYQTNKSGPSNFYVLIERPMGLLVRGVDANETSWAIRNGLEFVSCNPDPDSFAKLVKSIISEP